MAGGLPFGVEVSVLEDGAVVGEMDFVEVVHVELPDEGGEAVVAVVPGQNQFL